MQRNDDKRKPRATLDGAARRFATFRRISWREALSGFTAAPGRLHRYRALHRRLLDEVLERRERRSGEPGCGE